MFKFYCQCCGKKVKKLFFVCIVDDENKDHYFKLCSECGRKTLDELTQGKCSEDKEKECE